MPRFGFCLSGSYESQSPNAAMDRSMNLYPENIETQENQPMVLYGTPGLLEYTSAGNQTRGQWEINGRAFFVSDDALYETPTTPGAPTNRGNLANDLLPVSMVAYGTQLAIASAGILYVLDLTTNILTVVVDMVGVNVAKVDFCDGYYIALIGGTNTFRISALFDATLWDPLDEAVISVFPGDLISLIVDHREIWVFSALASTVYYNSGDADFPFDVNPSASVIEGGIAAINSIAKLDNTIFWVGKDTRGRGVIWKASGYTPTRVSTHAVEFAIQNYGDISDAVGYGYQDNGHSFYVLYFPTAEVLPHVTRTHTWCFDIATNLWHERGFWDSRLAEYDGHKSYSHVFFVNKHLVGDPTSGIIYEMNLNFYTDNGDLIRRERRAPHISDEQKWSFHSEMQVYIEPGVGPTPPLLDGMGVARDPVINLRWTDDSHNWSNEYPVGFGQTGQYAKRAIWRRLGRARDRVYEINVSDPVPIRIIDAFLTVEAGTS